MASSIRTLDVHTGTWRLGEWCPECLLSTGVEVDLLLLGAGGVTILSTLRWCAECGTDLKKIQRHLG